MMTIIEAQTPQFDSPTYRQRRAVAGRFFAGCIMMALAALIEQIFQIWNGLMTGHTSNAVLILLLGVVLLAVVGGILAFTAHRQLINWDYPSNRASDLRQLDERQKGDFLEAQAKAQQFYSWAAILATFALIFAGHRGYSWMFGAMLGNLILILVSDLPTVLMAWNEKDMEDEL